MTYIPKVFISYSHDNPDHKKWVAELAIKLVKNGIDTLLDQWDLSPGDDLAAFMERGVSEVDRVLVICSSNYVSKANAGVGGVGYEKMIVNAELVNNLGTNKFIPIIRENEDDQKTPKFLGTRLYIDFSDDAHFDNKFEELLRELHNEPVLQKPAIGKNPFSKTPLGAEAKPVEKTSPSISVLPETFTDPAETYNIARQIAESGAVSQWTRLVSEIRPKIHEDLANWRIKYERENLRDIESLRAAVDEAVGITAPLMNLALAGVESGRAKFTDQRGLLSDIIDISGWNYSGLTILVNLPYALAYVYQNLHGALCSYTGQIDIAVSLAEKKIRGIHEQNFEKLWQKAEIVGWPESLGGNCGTAWDYMVNAYSRLNWLSAIFTTEEDFRTSLIAYQMILNINELIDLIRNDKSKILDDENPIDLSIPLTFAKEGREINRRAFQLIINKPLALENLWGNAGISRETMESNWTKWMKHCHYWMRPNGGFGLRTTLEHKYLFEAL
ncbi:MAG: toll/interleukin-1 receptor domain-containing protein [Deltaproteobacteria bacterium]|nr:toll/interleukin-1 receptor domain-containing protein [Deltaproteobacteria bacterium]